MLLLCLSFNKKNTSNLSIAPFNFLRQVDNKGFNRDSAYPSEVIAEIHYFNRSAIYVGGVKSIAFWWIF